MNIDISIPYSPGIPPWPGDTRFSCGWTARRESGASVNIARVEMSAHSGTHADAPLHVESGWASSEALPIDAFMGEAHVVVIDDNTTVGGDLNISAEILATLLAEVDIVSRVLIRTGSSVRLGVFPDSWPSLDMSAVEWLVEKRVRLVGVDAPSIDARDSTSLPVHHALFAAGAYVLENLDLHLVQSGKYELLAQPVLMVGADAAPVRAVLKAP